jgi:hypothetical protein
MFLRCVPVVRKCTCSLLSAPTVRMCCPVRPGVWWGSPMAWAGGSMVVEGKEAEAAAAAAVFSRSDSFRSRDMNTGGTSSPVGGGKGKVMKRGEEGIVEGEGKVAVKAR